MASQNLSRTRVAPQTEGLITLHVLRKESITPHLVRVTLGGGDVADFVPLGRDQWFRLFLPVAGDEALSRLPNKLSTVSYLKFLTISKTERPILRNYTVRAHRADGPDGPEIDVDFVLHGSAAEGTAGPASTWAETCEPGATVALLDEGIGFNPPDGLTDLRLVADETGLPAVAAILEGLPPETTGEAIVEVPTAEDRQELSAPAGVTVRWVVREDAHAKPGEAALAAVQAAPVASTPFYGWTVGEQALATGVRAHWVAQGVPKENITFVGYWRVGKNAY